jgi:hypothetical protein
MERKCWIKIQVLSTCSYYHGAIDLFPPTTDLGYHVDQPVMTRSYGTKMLDQDPKQGATCSLPQSMPGHTCQTFSQNKSYRLIRYMAVRHPNPKQGAIDLFTTTTVNGRPHMPDLLPEQVLRVEADANQP